MQKTEQSNMFSSKEEKDYIPSMTSITCLEQPTNLQKDQIFVTPEFHLDIKKEILNDKYKIYEKNTHRMKSYRTSEVALTGKEKDSPNWWTEYCQEMSQKLWSCTRTDYADSDLTLLNKYVKKINVNSWYSIKITKLMNLEICQKTFSPLLQSFQQNLIIKITSFTKKSKPEANKCKKIRLFPTKKQKLILKKWIGTTRRTYNMCVNLVNEKKCNANMSELRKKFINNNSELIKLYEWSKKTPYDIRNEGMRDFIKAYTTEFNKKRKKFIKKEKFEFSMHYRKKKSNNQSIVIHSKHYSRNKGAYSFMNKMKAEEKLPEKILYDSRIVKDELNNFYFCINYNETKRCKNQTSDSFISLDPGVRKFLTGFDSNGNIIEFGNQDIRKIFRLCKCIDGLQSKSMNKQIRHKSRYNIKKAMKRCRQRIKNLVKEFHCNVIKFLVENYKTIILPIFPTQQMIKKINRKLNSNTSRNMCNWSHYKFKIRLINKIKEYDNVFLHIVDESWTSKTCSKCGSIKKNLGSSEHFKCENINCNSNIDRDHNASINIFVKFLNNLKQ